MSSNLALNLATFFAPAEYSEKAISSPINLTILINLPSVMWQGRTKRDYIGQKIKLKNRQSINIL